MLNDYEINYLLEMRDLGYSFSAISRALHINKESLKKYCRDHGIVSHAPRKTKAENARLTSCKECGKALRPNPKGRSREFCSPTCRTVYSKNLETNKYVNLRFVFPLDTPSPNKVLALCRTKRDELEDEKGGLINEYQ